MWFRRRKETDFHAEVESHIHLEAERLIAEGMSPAEAKVAARRAFGGVAAAHERFHESHRWAWWDGMNRDLRFALRLLGKSPVFTAAAMLTIALGVGANTAVFSLVDAVLLQILPVRAPKDLVFIDRVGNVPAAGAPAYPCLAQLPAATSSFTSLAIFANDEQRVEIDGRPEAVFGQAVSGSYFETLGVKPARGRLINIQDEQLNPPIAVIGDRYWERRFGRNPGVIGKAITVGDRTYMIAGVTPPEFTGLLPGRPVDVTTPIDTTRSLQTYSGPWWYDVVARLRSGISRERAQAASNAAFQACTGETRSARLALQPAAHGAGGLRTQFSRPLYALMGIVGFVLLLAVANIANLLLVRGIGRKREFAIRLATGAERGHLVRQLLTETLVLFGIGAIPGVLFARWGVALAETLFAQGRRPITLEASLNWRVLAFSAAVTLIAGLAASLFPIWRAFRAEPERAIKEGQTRTGESHGSAALMRLLVAFQVALSLVLLVGAIAFVRTLGNMRNVDTGFRNEDVITMSVELPDGYAQSGKRQAAWSRVLEAVRATPGVRVAALCAFTPLSGRDSTAQVRVRGYRPATAGDATVRVNHVSEGYFEALGIRLVRGRLIEAGDRDGAQRVALINESAARIYFGGRDPIGQPLYFPKKGAVDDVYRIAGIVQDTKHRNLREPALPFVFLPIQQPKDSYGRLTLMVAAASPNGQSALLEPVRRAIAGVDQGMFVSEVITMRRQVDSSLLAERLLSGLAAAFGALALLLASIGLYGVLSYRIGQQRQSIGVRMALGATPFAVAAGVLRQSGLVVAAGVACGLPFAFAAVRAAESMMWGVKPGDPAIYITGAAVLSIVGLASAYFPARRASAIDPAEALRQS